MLKDRRVAGDVAMVRAGYGVADTEACIDGPERSGDNWITVVEEGNQATSETGVAADEVGNGTFGG